MTDKKIVTIGILGSIAVSLGALGAHFLKSKIETGLITLDQVNGFDTGVKYHIYHTITMLIIYVLAKNKTSKYLTWAFNSFLIGIILFSGSLYFLCTRNLFHANWLAFLGPITPIGGLFFVFGWFCLIIEGFKSKNN